MLVQLLAGMFLGSIFISIIWGISLKASKTKAEKSRHEREKIMRSLGGLWTDVDELFSSHRSGTIEDQKFRDAFAAKIESINRVLKPNLHLLDVYYVKYIENLIGEYRRAIEKGEQPFDVVVDTASASEMETDISIIEQPEPADSSESSAATADIKKESGESGSGVEDELAALKAKIRIET